MIERLEMKRLTTGSVFKLLLIGTFCSMIPFSLVTAVLGLLGNPGTTLNGRPLAGIAGLIESPIIGATVSLLMSGMFGLSIAIGLWLYSRFKPLSVYFHSCTE